MKNNKVIGILLLVLIGLLAIVLLRNYIPQGDDKAEMYAQALGLVRQDDVQEFRVVAGEPMVTVTKGAGWRVNTHPADSELVDEILAALLLPTKVELVAETAARHKELGFDDEAEKIVMVDGGGNESEILLGTVSRGGRYVKFPDDDKVYLVSPFPNLGNPTEVNSWVDKTLVKINQEGISKLSISRKGSELVLEQKEAKWFQQDSEDELDSSSFSAALSTLASMVTQGLVGEEEQAEYPTVASLTVAVDREGQEPVVVEFYEGEDNVLVTSSEREGFYIISQSVFDNFNIDESDLEFIEDSSE